MSRSRDRIARYNVRRASPAPGKTALLIIDMQNSFAGIAAGILENVSSLIRAARAAGAPVLFTRHGHRDPARDGGMLKEWWGGLIRYGTPEWELIGHLPVDEGDPVLDKNRYSAFFGTDLEGRLRGWGVEDLVIAGVLTNCCCETTARDAFVRDFRVFFVADATAAAEGELHEASLMNLAYGFAYITETKDILKAFRNHGTRRKNKV